MKKIFLIISMFFFIACSEETIQNDVIETQQTTFTGKVDEAMHIQALQVSFTKAEENFHQKIRRFSSNEFDDKHAKLTQNDLEKFAISFLIEESKNLLLENGYRESQLEKEFKDEEIKLIHQALEIYGAKINSNQ